jgi:hypothetical protein
MIFTWVHNARRQKQEFKRLSPKYHTLEPTWPCRSVGLANQRSRIFSACQVRKHSAEQHHNWAVKSVRVDDISELSLVPSISVYSKIWYLCVLVSCTQVNMMFVMFVNA